jgi:hypothetical protein
MVIHDHSHSGFCRGGSAAPLQPMRAWLRVVAVSCGRRLAHPVGTVHPCSPKSSLKNPATPAKMRQLHDR